MRQNNQLKKYGGLINLKRNNKLAEKREKEAEWQAGVERVYHGVDRPLLIVVILLISIGAITLLSASYPYAVAEGSSELSYFSKTIIYIAIGTVAMVFCCFLSKIVDVIKKFTPVFYGATTLLLVAVLFIGKKLNGARRSISIASFSLQPSEIAKFVLIISIAWYFETFKDNLKPLDKKKRFIMSAGAPLAIFGVFVILILAEKHLSCIVIMTIIFVCMCIVNDIDFKSYGISTLVSGVAAATFYLIRNPYALARISTYADTDADTLDEAWQTSQGLLAIGNGGLLGTGFGQSSLKFSYISEPMNDFIFAVYCEEMGFVGALLLIILFGILVWRGFKIALHAKDTFSQLTAFGITLHIGLQALINILVVTDLFPNTGISLPFFSYGGSALIMQMVEMGVLLAISRHSYIKKREDK